MSSSEGWAVLEVIAPGLLTTIQDTGRPGHRDLGVPIGGACDPVGLAVANLVIGNRPGDAAIECTLLGPELLVLDDTVVGLGGADLGARLDRGGRRLAPGRAHRVLAGERIVFEPGADADACRAYLAVRGGIDVPFVLGSRSTSLVGAFGGFEGRPLRAGDRLGAVNGQARRVDPTARWPGALTPRALSAPVRVLAVAGIGPASGSGSPAGPLAALARSEWRVAAASDRRGIRLDGPPIDEVGDASAPSHGVVPGTVQLTPSGQPIVLLPDCGTTGGYPVIGVVIAADRWRLGQAGPGTCIAFEIVDHEIARQATSELRSWIAEGERRIRSASADSWDDLAGDANG